MVYDVLNTQHGMDLKDPVDVDVVREFVGPNANRLRSSLSSIAYNAK